MQVSITHTRRTALGSRIKEDSLPGREMPFEDLGLSEAETATLEAEGTLTVKTGKPEGPNGETVTVYTVQVPDADPLADSPVHS